MYIITAGTLNKEHFFKEKEKLSILQRNLFDVSMDFGWQLQSWAIFSNHYHIIAKSPMDSNNLKKLMIFDHNAEQAPLNKAEASFSTPY